jgi:hypothetical protein
MSHTSQAGAVLASSYQLKGLNTELNAALAALSRPHGLSCVLAEALMALYALGPASLNSQPSL